MDKYVLTVREVQAVLRISRPTVSRFIKSGKLKGFKIGGDWRITVASIEEYTGQPIPESLIQQVKKGEE